MQTYIPDNIEIFEQSASDFLNAEEGSWQDDRLSDSLPSCLPSEPTESEREEAAQSLAGFYWWSCSPGCLPDNEASGPFETELEAIEDAGGGEYDDDIYFLAIELGEDPADIERERYECYGMPVLSCGRAEYAVGTNEEADAAWEQALDSYIEDCIQPEIDRMDLGSLSAYLTFDEEAWKRDAKMDGRGHALSSYDGNEIELDGDLYAFRIN